MPTVVAGAALSAVFAGSAITAAGVLTVGFSLTTFAGSLILGGLSYALTPKPKKPAAQQNSDIGGGTVAVRQSELSRQHVFGHTMITRGYAHMWSTGINGELHLILILCEGELRAINEVLVNDYAIPNDWIDGDGNVTQGRYAGFLTIRKHLGGANQVADPVAVANLSEWTNNHRLQGIAYLYLILKKDNDIYPTGVPNFKAIVEGPELYDPRAEYPVWSTNIALYCREYLTNQTFGFGASENDIDDVNVAAQANICDEIVAVPEVNFTVSGIDTSTNIITLSGDILTLIWGDRVSVLSTGDLPAGLEADRDYFVIPYQINNTCRIMLAESLEASMYKDEVDITDAGTGTITIRRTGEPRYHGSGAIDTETALSENMNNLVNAMAGRAINVGGFWTLLAGAWRTPAVSFDEKDLRGSIGIKRGLQMSESYNVIKGLFLGPASFYQQTDYPSVRYDTFIEQDGDSESTKELNLAFTDRPTTATRIAKIELFRSRQDIVFKSDFSTKAMQIQPGDNVELSLEKYGWEEKVFEVTEFSFDTSQNNLLCRLTLRETAQEIFDWSEGEAIDFDPAPNTNLPDPFTVTVVTGFSLDSVAVYTQSGDRIFNILASWNLHENQSVVNDGSYQILYKETTEPDTSYKSAGVVKGNETQMRITTLQVDVLYDVQIIAYNRLGVKSQPSTINNFQVGSSITTNSEDWENETLARDGDDWENDSLSSEDWNT